MSKLYIAKQNKWIDKHQLKIGSKVKVLRKSKDYEENWGTVWNPDMNHTIGKTLSVCKFDGGWGVILDNERFYPYFVLEPMKEKLYTQKQNEWIVKPYKTTMTLTEIREFFSAAQK